MDIKIVEVDRIDWIESCQPYVHTLKQAYLYKVDIIISIYNDGTAEDRCEYRQQHSQPVMQQLYEWLNQHQLTVPSSSLTRPGDQLQPKTLAGTLPLSG